MQLIRQATQKTPASLPFPLEPRPDTGPESLETGVGNEGRPTSNDRDCRHRHRGPQLYRGLPFPSTHGCCRDRPIWPHLAATVGRLWGVGKEADKATLAVLGGLLAAGLSEREGVIRLFLPHTPQTVQK